MVLLIHLQPAAAYVGEHWKKNYYIDKKTMVTAKMNGLLFQVTLRQVRRSTDWIHFSSKSSLQEDGSQQERYLPGLTGWQTIIGMDKNSIKDFTITLCTRCNIRKAYLIQQKNFKTVWINSKGSWYFLDSDGKITGWIKDNGLRLLSRNNGSMQTGYANLWGESLYWCAMEKPCYYLL